MGVRLWPSPGLALRCVLTAFQAAFRTAVRMSVPRPTVYARACSSHAVSGRRRRHVRTVCSLLTRPCNSHAARVPQSCNSRTVCSLVMRPCSIHTDRVPQSCHSRTVCSASKLSLSYRLLVTQSVQQSRRSCASKLLRSYHLLVIDAVRATVTQIVCLKVVTLVPFARY